MAQSVAPARPLGVTGAVRTDAHGARASSQAHRTT